jgi:hypothetical protein
MKIDRTLLLLGLALYIASFFLIAVRNAGGSSSGGGRGYMCAFLALTLPWGRDGWNMLHSDPVSYFGILLSGWINPFFLITLLVRWIRPKARLGWILGALLLLMFPACWVVFTRVQLRPATGYFLWTGAMVLSLFSKALVRSSRERPAAASQ